MARMTIGKLAWRGRSGLTSMNQKSSPSTKAAGGGAVSASALATVVLPAPTGPEMTTIAPTLTRSSGGPLERHAQVFAHVLEIDEPVRRRGPLGAGWRGVAQHLLDARRIAAGDFPRHADGARLLRRQPAEAEAHVQAAPPLVARRVGAGRMHRLTEVEHRAAGRHDRRHGLAVAGSAMEIGP